MQVVYALSVGGSEMLASAIATAGVARGLRMSAPLPAACTGVRPARIATFQWGSRGMRNGRAAAFLTTAGASHHAISTLVGRL